MLQLAAPLGLLALGALVVPLALHLVRRPRQVVRLGSLQFLEGQRRQPRSLRWRDRLLLAVRCALLAALALLLAGPRWQKAPTPARWVLVVPGAALGGETRAEWDRLRAEGYEPRAMTAGFPRVDDEGSRDALARDEVPDAWSLLREADWRLPPGSRAVVFGPAESGVLRGTRPALFNVHVSWRATEVRSQAPTARATSPIRVAIVAAADRGEDAQYLRAAFTAVGGVEFADTAPDWIFQLGDVPLEPRWAEAVERGARLVTDPRNAARPTRAPRTFDVGGVAVPIRQRAPAEAGAPVLFDSAGEPLVTEQRRGAGWEWQFALRFHPEWTDWPHTSAFPAWWRAQLFPSGGGSVAVAAEQASPSFAAASADLTPRFRLPDQTKSVDLRMAPWLLAAGLFLVERILSARVQRKAPA